MGGALTLTLAKQIFFGRADDSGGGILHEAVAIDTNDNDWSARGLAHEQSGRGGEFIGHSEDRGAQKFAMAVTRTTKIDERGHTESANGHVGEPQTPRPAERVANNQREALAGLLA